MRSVEPLVAQESSYFNHVPSQLAKAYFLYPLCAGDFVYQPGYALSRSTFGSWLLEVIISGSLEVEEAGEVYSAKAGDIVLLDCHKPHGYRSNQGWRALWAHFDGVSAAGYADLIVRQGPVLRHPGGEETRRCLQALFDLLSRPVPDQEADMALLLTQALTALCRPAEQETENRSQAAMRAIIAKIKENPGREPAIADMARQASMSTYHFIRVFAQTVGATPRQYVIASRMSHARYLLAHTDWTVAAIAEQVGYSSESMFCLTFKKTQGMTPTGFRLGREEERE